MKCAHDHRNHDEHHESENVLAVLDRKRVEGRCEVPVHEQESDNGGGEGGPRPTDSGDGNDEKQVQKENAGETDAVPGSEDKCHRQGRRTEKSHRPAREDTWSRQKAAGHTQA